MSRFKALARGWKLLKLYRANRYLHDAEIACSLFQKVGRDERRQRLAQVDTVDKDVSLLDCGIRSWLGGLVLSEFRGQHNISCCELPKQSFLLLNIIEWSQRR